MFPDVTTAAVFFISAVIQVASASSLEVVLPTGKSVWVANDKTRQVIFTQRQHQDISSWTVQILDSQGQSVVNFPNQILLATSGGDDESSRYQTSLPVPQYVGTGTYRVRVCGQPEVKAAEKCCAESGDFHIEGTSLEGTLGEDLHPHEWRFHARRERQEKLLLAVDLEQLWPVNNTRCTIPRVHNPSREEFTERFMKQGKPCIISGVMDEWDAMRKWQFDKLQEDPELTEGFVVGQRQEMVSLRQYTRYMRERAPRDLVPWMIFMPDVFDMYPHLREDYKLPAYFAEEFDFMNQVEDELRMDWRWIIMAPKRSGSGWHVDPANTTGWLGLVTGAKLWGMYPPTTHHVPGVKNNFYQKRDYKMEDAFHWWVYTRPHLGSNLPLECVQKPGDIVFIPSGWWHSVLNLDNTLAVTQNFCNEYSLKHCLTELREQADSDGGFIGRTFEKLRSLYSQSHPQFFDEHDLAFEAPLEGEGLAASEDQERRLENLKEFLAGKRPFVQSEF